MDVFDLRRRLIDEYGSYASSFIRIADERIRSHVDQELRAGLLWPEPLVQLNPAFEAGGYIDELVDRDVLHPECRTIFRIKTEQGDKGKPLRLHRHQAEAIQAAQDRGSYVLTTGTGSGKSLAYIVPIVDAVLKAGQGRGIKAIVVYPMNALANSQAGELRKFLSLGYPDGRVPLTFARYTGQESDEERVEITQNPPDILLTNYVMLELILTRPFEKKLVKAASGLRFLVLDELHTHRGRQGADVAMLVRRVREACRATDLQCIGTSATLAGSGTHEEQQQEVARVATQLFGTTVKPEHVIVETLRRATPPVDLDDAGFQSRLTERIRSGPAPAADPYQRLIDDPLSAWIESTFGIREDAQSGRIRRQVPRSITGTNGAAQDLSKATGVPEDAAAFALEQHFMTGYMTQQPDTGFQAFAFRLHQFISRGETVYVSLEPEDSRYITTQAQTFVPGDRRKILVPLVFCRECGQEYPLVWLVREPGTGERSVIPRDSLSSLSGEGGAEAGFLYASMTNRWPTDATQVIQRLPDDWLEEAGGVVKLKSSFKKLLPRSFPVGTDGSESATGLEAWFIPAPFRMCLSCGVAYVGTSRSDFPKLATLGSGGRSTSTTILSLSTIRGLRRAESLSPKARKLLSFMDNRQDASLQAGHFNDFVQIGLLRSALYQAAAGARAEGLTHDVLAQRVFDALNLPKEMFAVDPGVRFAAEEQTKKALRNVIGYRLYRDLERGWRITSPNLEQCGLLQIDYQSLDDVCSAEDVWEHRHPALATADPTARRQLAKTLLDFMRRELAIKVDYLGSAFQEQIQQQSSQHLISPWAIEDQERLEQAAVLVPRSRRPSDYGGYVHLSPAGGFGRFLSRGTTFPNSPGKLSRQDKEKIILDLLEGLRVAGLVERVLERSDDVPGYQVPAAVLRWHAGDGTTPFRDPIRLPQRPETRGETNAFFVNFYRTVAEDLKGLQAREHTAQVPSEIREEREEAFREARLPILYCSPTMELGVDIAELNAVNMRNVPPTPANYAQRSGRAGRSGQPALVFTYCATGSPHDQYFFRRPTLMVSGQVTPPRLDLANEDLVRAHVHAIWLAETGKDLKRSLVEILDVSGDEPSLELKPDVLSDLENPQARERARTRAQNVLATIQPDLQGASWYTDDWLDTVINQAVKHFDTAADRWRNLYRAARKQRDVQNKVIVDASRPARDKDQARRIRAEAESQLQLLTAVQGSAMQSDFYSYRYFANEGFLPGYSFPRLPLSAYIPGRLGPKGKDSEFVSRPRFLAISEFGPRAFIYHEGSRFQIEKVILPVEEDQGGERIITQRAKQCTHCGYLHPGRNGTGPDLCEFCGRDLDGELHNLFRLQNVTTRRRERISSDEEERQRIGFEIRSGVRFAEPGSKPSVWVATIERDGHEIARLTYGHAATLWRINMGWTRGRETDGFNLDIDTGRWGKSQVEDGADDGPLGPRIVRVIPFVEDRRNCLMFGPADDLDDETMASLQAALKNAIQVEFQLEDGELAAEPLPDAGRRRLLLFYEAAEGGAGVLRRLIEEPKSLSRVAQRALEICHFDPSTGDDRRRAPNAKEDCEAACYDCLMSYTNQRDHQLLDRMRIRDNLLELVEAEVNASPTLTRAEKVQQLMNGCDSELERSWLRFIDEGRYRIPSKAQSLVEECHARPDFLYGDQSVTVFIDGPHHLRSIEHDQSVRNCLEDLGYQVIRFPVDEDWTTTVQKYPHVFGEGA